MESHQSLFSIRFRDPPPRPCRVRGGQSTPVTWRGRQMELLGQSDYRSPNARGYHIRPLRLGESCSPQIDGSQFSLSIFEEITKNLQIFADNVNTCSHSKTSQMF